MIIQKQTSYYGNFEMKLVAVFDCRQFAKVLGPNIMGQLQKNEFSEADEQFRKKWSSMVIIPIPTQEDPTGDTTFSIFVPTEDINKNWYANNKDCGYVECMQKNNTKPVKFPLMITQKKIDSVLEKHPSMKLPKDFSDMEDLNQYYFTKPDLEKKKEQLIKLPNKLKVF